MVMKPPTKRSSSKELLKKKINRLSRDEKVELLQQLNIAYHRVYNIECLNTKQDYIQSDALCEIVKIYHIVNKSLQ